MGQLSVSDLDGVQRRFLAAAHIEAQLGGPVLLYGPGLLIAPNGGDPLMVWDPEVFVPVDRLDEVAGDLSGFASGRICFIMASECGDQAVPLTNNPSEFLNYLEPLAQEAPAADADNGAETVEGTVPLELAIKDLLYPEPIVVPDIASVSAPAGE